MSIFDNAPVLTASSRNESGQASSNDSSASRKRKRDVARRTPSPTAPGFSSSTVRWLLSTYSDCWLCGAEPLDACHVVARADVEWRDFQRLGLLSIDNLDDVGNAIVLCPNCHRVYDRTPASPGFVFFPKDIRWFLRCEVADYERRKMLREANKHRTVRVPPTAQQYMEYQQGEEQATTEVMLGGLYARCILRDYFPWKTPGHGPVNPGPVSPAAWHGDPMTSLKRTFAVLANPMVRGIPHEVRRQLLELSALYSAHDEEDERLVEDYAAGDDSQQSRSDGEQGHRTREEQAFQGDRSESRGTQEGDSRMQQPHSTARSGGFQQRQYVNAIAAWQSKSPRGRRRTSSWGDSGIALEPRAPTAIGWRKRKGTAHRSDAQRSEDAWEWGPMATSKDAAEHFSRIKRIRQ